MPVGGAVYTPLTQARKSRRTFDLCVTVSVLTTAALVLTQNSELRTERGATNTIDRPSDPRIQYNSTRGHTTPLDHNTGSSKENICRNARSFLRSKAWFLSLVSACCFLPASLLPEHITTNLCLNTQRFAMPVRGGGHGVFFSLMCPKKQKTKKTHRDISTRGDTYIQP